MGEVVVGCAGCPGVDECETLGAQTLSLLAVTGISEEQQVALPACPAPRSSPLPTPSGCQEEGLLLPEVSEPA